MQPCYWQYLSAYKYVKIDKTTLPSLRRQIQATWDKIGVLGRIYISTEGINAQLMLPEANVDALAVSFPELLSKEIMVFGQRIEMGAADTLDGQQMDHEPNNDKKEAPFTKLDVRIREQIVKDGFDKGELNLQDAGEAIDPSQWHQELSKRNALEEMNAPSKTVVLDVRNFYEHEIGRFEGATRIMVDTFKDTFSAVDDILNDYEKSNNGEKPDKVMMYCTGGIRCEKVGAYVRQHKQIDNVQKLKGGIVSYANYVNEQESKPRSLFRGKNFVFDQRCVTRTPSTSGEEVDANQVTDDVLGKCFQCGAPCNQHTNCSNDMCGRLILHCSDCISTLSNACSEACKQEHVKMRKMDLFTRRQYRKQNASKWKPTIPNALPIHTQLAAYSTSNNNQSKSPKEHEYCKDQSTALSDADLLHELREQTLASWSKSHQMVDESQGQLLRFLVRSLNAKRVLEIGTFTGYSALCMAGGLDSTGSVVTCDVDPAAMKVAQSFFRRSKHHIDGRVTDGLEELARLKDEAHQFDFIFVDANKRKYGEYYNAIMDQELLAPNGLLAFDNTLFRGRVVASANGEASHKERIARSVRDFNALVAKDVRTIQILLPLWDGLTLIRHQS